MVLVHGLKLKPIPINQISDKGHEVSCGLTLSVHQAYMMVRSRSSFADIMRHRRTCVAEPGGTVHPLFRPAACHKKCRRYPQFGLNTLSNFLRIFDALASKGPTDTRKRTVGPLKLLPYRLAAESPSLEHDVWLFVCHPTRSKVFCSPKPERISHSCF
ncbi:hypothetical protein AB1N83_002442 [Pleurotus pulmonarius]